MKSCFNHASHRGIHVFLCSSAAVLLSACGGGTSDPGSEQQNQAAAPAYHGVTIDSGAPVASGEAGTPDSTHNGAADATTLLATTAADGIQAPQAGAKAPCNYYIAPTGSDRGAGTYASPWKTIKHGSGRLTPGQTLCARGGTYYGQGGLIWSSSGTASKPVTFRNYPGERAVFDGEWGDTGTDGNFLVFSNNSHVVVDSIVAQRYADKYGNGTIDLHNGRGPVNNITIQNSTLMDNGSHPNQDHHIYLATGATNVTIRNNLFIRAAGSAIQAYHSPASSGIKIYNNVMIGGTLRCNQSKTNGCSSRATQHWGLIIGDAASTQIYHNTIYGMQYGMDFNYGTSTKGPYVVKNNLIMNSTSVGIRVAAEYAANFTSDHNGFSGNRSDINWKGSNMNAAQFASATSNERNAVRANPQFVDAGSGNFHLSAGSPMIDKAGAMPLSATDKDGNARKSGAGLDIGAYEKK